MEQEGFKHIMENVLNITAETREALNQQGINTIPDLLNEPFDILDKLEYRPMVTNNDGNQPPSRSKKPVARGSIRLLMIFIDYCSYRYAQSLTAPGSSTELLYTELTGPVHEGYQT